MSIRYNIINPITLPLKKNCLIEASAGTGKTYTLVVIYLRLLLGLGQTCDYYRPLKVTEILLVTFTETTTKELRSRIRDNIYRLRISCYCGHSDDPLLAALLSQITNLKLAFNQLLMAEQQIDEAAIFTIHGFCQRMINHSSIQSGLIFQPTLLTDELNLLKQVSADFWRRYFYQLPENVALIVQKHWTNPDNLLAELLPYLYSEAIIICSHPREKNESIIDRYIRIIDNIDAFKQQWCAIEQDLLPIILNINLIHLLKLGYSNKNILYSWKKISLWAASRPTVDDEIPKELELIKYVVIQASNIMQKHELQHNLLYKAIENLFLNPLSLREFIVILAIEEIRKYLAQEKQIRNEIGFNDLLIRFDSILTSNIGNTVAKYVRSKYPIAIIDEFQDTDSKQYRILSKIYGLATKLSVLFLIGDPKQAIYSFRGADIFTYMLARKLVADKYTLETNWRSSPGMINAVNKLFQCLPNPFIFSKITFKPVVAASCNANLRFVLYNKHQPAMQLWLETSNAVGVIDYNKIMANQCATTISNWLIAASANLAFFENNQGKKILQASDIAILVRNRNEAVLIRDALTLLSISSVYLSNLDSVFKTTEAREILLILEAVVSLEQDNKNNKIRCALTTRLLGCNAEVIYKFNFYEFHRKKWITEFNFYRKIWLKHGILPMLYHLITRNHIAELLLGSSGGERSITNVLHLCELLQEEASKNLDNEYALVRWLSSNIRSPNENEKNQQLWLESDRNLVKIITVHKSKGLEFPIVILPFASNFRKKKLSIFHDRKKYQYLFDISNSPNSIKLADEERLAEDLRLLYVAVTRSIYHCCISIAPIFHGNRKKIGTSDFHSSAIGFLIQQKQIGNAVFLRSKLENLMDRAAGDIGLLEINNNTKSLPVVQKEGQKYIDIAAPISVRVYKSNYFDIWQITSYTGLHKIKESSILDLHPNIDVETAGDNQKFNNKEIKELTPHTFPCGALAGTFLHRLFEKIDFTTIQIDSTFLSTELKNYNIDQCWLPMLKKWIKTIITTSLNGTKLSLSMLDRSILHVEWPFLLTVKNIVKAQEIDKLCKHYDKLSALCPPLDFLPIKGMLKGVIDLVFCWKKRYYLLDYKSNWLGEASSAYTKLSIEQAMINNRYELQYQLYTLALHRYLRHRLLNYDYEIHFGGVFYLFVRGFDIDIPNKSIYICRPDKNFIDRLDKMFNG
ncbi:exodeoxyribonuclease V subunit beta [Candidatus Palibaumannia cicadellinicola]|uniref:RecBCD enzyme subunit RecB n=1 Tax=Candidatus Palibaumannia cicadellinicola TaxID=186490 RepID=A0A0K2BLL6_9GAMM|nr:exodeoxyribonuclease V subunit beta [Candidatus Baumannia cicadellinicola]AKZ66077.1 Exodeoxyribonuclease V beta chain [Candidatus Baumannia cicadellinicola]